MHERKARAEALEDAIAELAAHIHAATYRLLRLVAEYDRGEYWATQGFKSCAAWLGWRVGLGGNAAREKVRVARALEGLPRVAAALRDGRISYAKARAITRVATAGIEDDLLAIAEHGTAHHVETVCRLYRKASSTADHLQVVLHVDAAVLASSEQAGCCHVESAGSVPPATAQQVACDASLVMVSHDRRGRVVDVARKRRVVSPSLRRALRGRQPACAFPGCDHTRHLEAHHIRHWAHGGKTTLQNLVLLCSHHHRALHEGRFSLQREKDGALRFRSLRGTLAASPSLPHGEPAALGRERPDIDAGTLGTWDGVPWDVGWAVGALVARASV